jgi:iron complex transport system ATP-binding protein
MTIEIKNLTGGYGTQEKLHNISLCFPPNRITAIVGPNGCGKSTLLKIVGGLQRPFSGIVMLDGTDISLLKRAALAKSIAYLPQARNIPNIAARSLVLHGRFPHLGYPRRYGRDDRDIAQAAMEMTGVSSLADANMAELSGGERQKVYLAMVIAQDARCVFLDEPTTYLDIACQLEIMRLIGALKERGKTVVVVLHDLNLALRCADRIVVMENGAARANGKPADVCDSGVLEEVFGVHIGRCHTTSGIQYFFT